MKPRLSRPLLAAFVSGAIVAGGVVYTAPVLAAGPVASPAAAIDATDTPEPTETSGSPTATETTTSAAPVETTTSAAPVETTTSAAPVETTTSAAPVETTTSASPTPTKTTTSPAPVKTTTPAPKDTKAPTGSFRLSATSIWTGQKVTFSQSAAEYQDDRDADSAITRKISWGDGTSTTLAANATSYAKQYTRAGRFNVTETLTDRSGNRATTAAKVVSVTVPAKWALSRYTIYQGARFEVSISKVPAGTDKIHVDWGDGWIDTLGGRDQKFGGTILYRKNTDTKISGKVKMRIAFTNKNGWTGWLPLATVNVLKDNWKPKLTVTKPKKPNKISSWKTIKGTLTDKGSGVTVARVTIIRVTTSGKLYCLTQKKKWKRYTTEAQFMKHCGNNGVEIKPSKKGNWSMKVPSGVTKGQIVVLAWTYDRAHNYAGKNREATLTKK
ncbi:outer membrane biosynthesis protein TonB [Actinoplanes lutulentus]|uniref:PKD domain-containing protein n=1 Tax=Actinoplanes lutulentus TaxID=1287878 RepID=A0A327ZD00_9ACTN|nr:hypothetical protein [Actinoplanes lutulentus]MBB2945975.1 outer membrane biosynthesis protein TonB [Actinoplanes lutulentus]RAK38022.1 hypothetical protein B0I29_106292 [Actinoplanes lutulentus]